MSGLEQHHIRYEELHGEDEIILLTSEEHKKVHVRDRANGSEPIPKWIRDAAHARSPIGKARNARYARSEKGKLVNARKHKKLNQTEKGKMQSKAASARWRAKQNEATS